MEAMQTIEESERFLARAQYGQPSEVSASPTVNPPTLNEAREAVADFVRWGGIVSILPDEVVTPGQAVYLLDEVEAATLAHEMVAAGLY